MARGILYVETAPASPEEAEAYHKWYNDVHMPEICAVDGFVRARRYEPVGHEGRYVSIYEVEADDLDKVRAAMVEASPKNTPPVGVMMDPPPAVLWFREIAEYRK